jgi:energy-coupling factor transport system ATP-binding protein
VALVQVDRLSFSYPGTGRPALADVSFELEPGEVIALIGPSGSGKSTLLRAFAGLVPHFHGGRFSGRVCVDGRDTRRARPAELASFVATVFQDPEDQAVMTLVENEVAFGLENLGTSPDEIWPRVDEALAAAGALHLRGRRLAELSGGELQRVVLAAALAPRPRLVLLDEPTSQLDPETARAFLDHVAGLGATVVLSEQRIERALSLARRVIFVEGGRLRLDAPRAEALSWLEAHRPRYAAVDHDDNRIEGPSDGAVLCRLASVSFGYRRGEAILAGADLEVRRGEIVAVAGPSGAGKTTLAKVAAGLLQATGGRVERAGRAGYLCQDPCRYLVCERVLDEAALAVAGDHDRAHRALARAGLSHLADRHPRDLSSGERQRLAVAAVAVAEPDLLVLDEPTRGVDPDRKAELAAWLLDYARPGRSVLLATHDLGLPAHRRFRLENGVLEPFDAAPGRETAVAAC